MAKLYFHYGAMNSGKTIELIRAAHNYQEQGMRPFIIKPGKDTKGNEKITSRIGAERKVDLLISPDSNILDLISKEDRVDKIHCVFVDEAQFLEPTQIDQLLSLTLPPISIPVMAYGLRGDFKTNGFPGSSRLLEVSDVIKEIRTICSCGKNATFNARKLNGEFVTKGTQVAIDGESKTTYESLCGTCYTKKVGPISSAN
jgi:thymidine kinase